MSGKNNRWILINTAKGQITSEISFFIKYPKHSISCVTLKNRSKIYKNLAKLEKYWKVKKSQNIKKLFNIGYSVPAPRFCRKIMEPRLRMDVQSPVHEDSGPQCNASFRGTLHSFKEPYEVFQSKGFFRIFDGFFWRKTKGFLPKMCEIF